MSSIYLPFLNLCCSVQLLGEKINYLLLLSIEGHVGYYLSSYVTALVFGHWPSIDTWGYITLLYPAVQ